MKEIGGYIELDTYSQTMLHEGAIRLNCGRNALAYLIKAKHIKKIYIPKFLCDSVRNVCKRENVIIEYYSIGTDFLPANLPEELDGWLYFVNYYGQIRNSIIKELANKYTEMIVDNVQAYFQTPVGGIDTIYSCRKFFGVADGSFLYTDTLLKDELEQDVSYNRMNFLLGRFERNASEFYQEYVKNNDLFDDEPIKKMSKLTDNLLHAIDYKKVKKQRKENFQTLHNSFKTINKLVLTVPNGAFIYPLYVENGAEIRKELQKMKIYIPTLWPDTFDVCDEDDIQCHMAQNILPLPCDQRYGKEEMAYVIEKLKNVL